jgi:hypothetical protein
MDGFKLFSKPKKRIAKYLEKQKHTDFENEPKKQKTTLTFSI